MFWIRRFRRHLGSRRRRTILAAAALHDRRQHEAALRRLLHAAHEQASGEDRCRIAVIPP